MIDKSKEDIYTSVKQELLDRLDIFIINNVEAMKRDYTTSDIVTEILIDFTNSITE